MSPDYKKAELPSGPETPSDRVNGDRYRALKALREAVYWKNVWA